jgi:3-oxoacyl-(acyl-carrier-protein) synthase
VPIFVPVSVGGAEDAAAEGALGVAAGETAAPPGVVCAHATSERLNTAATKILINLLVIDPLDSFGLVPES